MQEGCQWKGGLSANKNESVHTQQDILEPAVKKTTIAFVFLRVDF